MLVDALGIRRRLGRDEWSSPYKFLEHQWVYDRYDRTGRIIVSCAPYDGVEWVHASISRPQMPTYDDLKHMHLAVFGDGWSYQVFTPPSEHVNIHEHCLHLFGRFDGQRVLPDFTMGTGQI